MSKPNKPQPQLSPKQYITQGKARKLPIYECLINPDWQEKGMATILVARQHQNGNLTFSSYLVDVFCLGLKNTTISFNKEVDFYEDYLGKFYELSGQESEEIDYEIAHNIIYGAIAYAEDLGFKPEKDWALSQFVLEEDDDNIELLEIEFGKNGQPFFVAGPYDNVAHITAQLRRSVGEGNFTSISPLGFDSINSLSFLDEDEDNDDDEKTQIYHLDTGKDKET